MECPKLLADDLGPLIKHILGRVQRNDRPAAVDAANLVRVLHARGKWNEKKKRGLRPVLEEDSELALRAVGFLLHEFGWTAGN